MGLVELLILVALVALLVWLFAPATRTSTYRGPGFGVVVVLVVILVILLLADGGGVRIGD